MKIKVCGITSLEQMQQLRQLGIDYTGMIFYESSKRYAGEKMKKEKLKIKNCEIEKVGVFVNTDYKTIAEAINDYGLTAIQLHGDETPELCKQLRDKAEMIKVFRIKGEESIDELVAPFQNVCDYFLFDTETKEYGGSGKQFNWRVLQEAEINKPFFLSGGIGLKDVEKLKAFNHPYFYAVDVNSCFEIEPGVKDMNEVKALKNSIV